MCAEEVCALADFAPSVIGQRLPQKDQDRSIPPRSLRPPAECKSLSLVYIPKLREMFIYGKVGARYG